MPANKVSGHLTLYFEDEMVRVKYFMDRLQRQSIMAEWKRQIKLINKPKPYFIHIQLESNDAD